MLQEISLPYSWNNDISLFWNISVFPLKIVTFSHSWNATPPKYKYNPIFSQSSLNALHRKHHFIKTIHCVDSDWSGGLTLSRMSLKLFMNKFSKRSSVEKEAGLENAAQDRHVLLNYLRLTVKEDADVCGILEDLWCRAPLGDGLQLEIALVVRQTPLKFVI